MSSNKSVDLITAPLEGWRPSPGAQHIIVWRLLHLLMSRYGSIPVGQALVSYTVLALNEMGVKPTVTELCEATGLPKSSISRYVSAQMDQGVLAELIDPEDRRRRKLGATDTGRAERRWLIREMRKVLEDIHDWDVTHFSEGAAPPAPEQELAKMREVVAEQPPEFGQPAKRGRRRTA